jgi:hypothetical protein
MLDAVGQGVPGVEPAAVVRSGIGLVALHAPVADAAPAAAAQGLGSAGAVRLAVGVDSGASC